ncbi:hypothetical protein DC522_33120 [Microvirga sp. KLBC 81]|nr:hypothetical protein DC522_33120 [Microvirga sp. KLBC 81]
MPAGYSPRNPAALNGYPLVAHGGRRGRDLNERTKQPLDIRHGSTIADHLFETAIASGITSFEGGDITYNLPHAKKVPLEDTCPDARPPWRERRLGGLAAKRVDPAA